jgi:hypothetical protein
VKIWCFRIYPELVEALRMEPRTSSPFYNIEIIQSRNRTEFLSFAKSRKFQKELYEDLAAPFFKSGNNKQKAITLHSSKRSCRKKSHHCHVKEFVVFQPRLLFLESS